MCLACQSGHVSKPDTPLVLRSTGGLPTMLSLRWPWRRQTSNDQLVVSWSGKALAYVLARAGADGTHEVLKFGVEHPGSDSTDVLVPRLNALGLKGLTTHI